LPDEHKRQRVVAVPSNTTATGLFEDADPHDLQRFVAVQAPVYEHVVSELRAGQKRSHWMWFIFPQLSGLGSSAMARRYAIRSREEARGYLAHQVLAPRLRECTQLVLDTGRRVTDIFGHPDDLKFHSSMTLFRVVAPEESVFREAIARLYAGQQDSRTLTLLAQ
jgi:uncharacterized protein (DUF1810 family)